METSGPCGAQKADALADTDDDEPENLDDGDAEGDDEENEDEHVDDAPSPAGA